MKLKELEAQLTAKQAALGKVFEEALVGGGTDGAKQYDFTQVKCLGEDVKGSIAVAEKVKAMNTELDDIGVQVETLRAAEQAAAKHAERESAVKRPPFPGKSTRSEEHTSELQSLMRISYAVFCLKKKQKTQPTELHQQQEGN